MIPKRLVWMAVGASAAQVARWRAERAVDDATNRLEETLPPSLRRVNDLLPGDVLRTGGALVASGKAARSAAQLSRTSARVAGKAAYRTTSTVVEGQRLVRRSRDRVEATVRGVGEDWRHAAESETRRMRSEYLRAVEGEAAATDALLDHRGDRRLTAGHDGPLPSTPDPVPAGRRRSRKSLPEPPVNRVQRTYRPPRNRW